MGSSKVFLKTLAIAGGHVFHGTTVATNTILEMDGVEYALLTTTSFRKGNMVSVLVELTYEVERIYEMDSRMDFEGHELAPLCEE